MSDGRTHYEGCESNPYTTQHDPARRDAWDEGYDAALAAERAHADLGAAALRWIEDDLIYKAPEQVAPEIKDRIVQRCRHFRAAHESRRKSEAGREGQREGGSGSTKPGDSGSAGDSGGSGVSGQPDPLRAVAERAIEWRELRREYEALSASVQARYADLGRPPGFSAWNEDDKERHNWLLGQMLVKLNALEQAVDAAAARKEASDAR